MSVHRILSLFLMLFLAAAAALPARAQDQHQTQTADNSRAATGGAQTLEEIMARQKALIGQTSIGPRGTRNIGDAPSPSGPLGPRGGASVSDLWNQLRGGDPTDLFQPRLPGQVMATSGQQWRLLRVNFLRKYLGWGPLGVLVLLAVFYLLRGPMRVTGGRSGRMIPRFDLFQRVAHWLLASVFLFLGTTGLLILLGRELLAPVIGKEANSILLSASMQGHNLFGPIFIVSLLWMFVKFLPGNFFQIVDFKWILKLGGFFGGHVSSRRYNFGEKTWFWLVMLVGLVLSVSGIVMLFPWLVDDNRWLQLSNVLHVTGAVGMILVALGHIYVGSIGMEGSLDAMVRGEVDENWAKEHHDLWYEEVKDATEAKQEAAE